MHIVKGMHFLYLKYEFDSTGKSRHRTNHIQHG